MAYCYSKCQVEYLLNKIQVKKIKLENTILS